MSLISSTDSLPIHKVPIQSPIRFKFESVSLITTVSLLGDSARREAGLHIVESCLLCAVTMSPAVEKLVQNELWSKVRKDTAFLREPKEDIPLHGPSTRSKDP